MQRPTVLALSAVFKTLNDLYAALGHCYMFLLRYESRGKKAEKSIMFGDEHKAKIETNINMITGVNRPFNFLTPNCTLDTRC